MQLFDLLQFLPMDASYLRLVPLLHAPILSDWREFKFLFSRDMAVPANLYECISPWILYCEMSIATVRYRGGHIRLVNNHCIDVFKYTFVGILSAVAFRPRLWIAILGYYSSLLLSASMSAPCPILLDAYSPTKQRCKRYNLFFLRLPTVPVPRLTL